MTDCSIPQKRCTKCHTEYPDTPEHFRVRGGHSNSQCRKCEIEYKRQRRRANGIPERRLGEYRDGFLRCLDCGEFKPATAEFFQVNRQTKTGLVSHCKQCRREYIRAYRRKPEQIAREKAYRSRIDTRAQKTASERSPSARARQRAYRRTSQVFRQYKNSEKYHDLQRKYAQSERGRLKARLKTSARRTQQRQLPHRYTELDWYRTLAYFDNCCAVCGRPAGLWHTLAQDHWIPITSPECPGTIPTNIVPLCQGVGGCNNSKNNRPAREWLRDVFGERKAKTIMRRINQYFEWVKTYAE